MATIRPPFPVCLFSLLLSSLLPSSISAQPYKNISRGSSLTAQGTDSFWLSPSSEFAFGFQQVETSGFLLAIWFNKIPERTIVWSANGNALAPPGSKVGLATDGQLILTATNGTQIWQANYSGTGVDYAAILDTGNFVLAATSSIYLWETFKHPTDTILPSQTMAQGTTLVARYGEAKFSDGRYMFILQTDGNLVSYAKHSPQDSYIAVSTAYWNANTFGNDTELIFNMSGLIYLIAKNGSTSYVVSDNPYSTQDNYQRAILEHDGVFRHYVYPKNNNSSRESPMAWISLKAMPSNICLVNVADRGFGPCGFNSYCTYVDQKTSCHCPEGFSFIDPNDWSKGCKQNFVSQSCDEAAPETDLYYFYDMPKGDWHLSDYEQINAVTEENCRQSCLADCFCAAAIYRDGNCYKKKSPLSNGRMDYTLSGKAMVKTSKGGFNSTFPPGGGYYKYEDNSTLIAIGSVILSILVFFNILFLLAIIMLLRSKKRITRKTESLSLPNTELKCFTYREIKMITDDFKEEIGSGAFGKVFKGFLPSDGGHHIAVKRFNDVVGESEKQFKSEVSAIARTNHRNLVKLIGFCNEEQHRLLVYEFMSNGSLASSLFGVSDINLNSRIQIALDTARGLLYLHEGCSTQIIHCDIKPQNILLDNDFTAKISDFGMAKLLKIDQTRTMTAIRGTKGYVAPEWFRTVPITIKVDVYSYGIVLLELICRRKTFDAEAPDANQMVLADWAYDCYMDRKLEQLVKDDKEALEDLEKVEKYVKIGIWCIQEDPEQRPTMNRVVQMIEGSAEVPIPPDPSPSKSSSVSNKQPGMSNHSTL